MAEKLVSPCRFVSLDDLQTRLLAERDPRLLLGEDSAPLIIDEAQYAPALFPEVKRQVDEARRQERPPRDVWITGSSAVLLAQNVRESLAGRSSHVALHTCGAAELKRADLFSREIFLRGGWPELYKPQSQDGIPHLDPARYLGDYERTFLEKDIALVAGVQKLGEFTRLLSLWAGRTGQQLNHSDVAAQVGVRSTTAEDWLSLLESNSIVGRLRTYHSNRNKRIVKTPKLYFLDVGLASRLQGWRSIDPLWVSPAIGALFETLVYGELIRARDHRLLPLELFYWRTKEGEEVDFLVRLETAEGEKWITSEAKFGSFSPQAFVLPKPLAKEGLPIVARWIVTFEGVRRALSADSVQVPVFQLADEIEKVFQAHA